jgi:hypothetical protein
MRLATAVSQVEPGKLVVIGGDPVARATTSAAGSVGFSDP